MQKKRIICLLLIMTLLTGCSNKSTTQTPTQPAVSPTETVVTAAPTVTPEPTATPVPTQVVEEPTATPVPTEAITEPTTTPVPTVIPEPTKEVAQPTVTPEPAQAKITLEELTRISNDIIAKDGHMMMNLGEDKEALKDFYNIDADSLEGYCINMPMMNTSSTEYAFFMLKDGDDPNTVIDLIKNGRLSYLEKQWEQYLVDQLELVQNCKLGSVGNVVYFIISDIADYAESSLKHWFDPSVEVADINLRPFMKFDGQLTKIEDDTLTIEKVEGDKRFTITCKMDEDSYIAFDLPKEVKEEDHIQVRVIFNENVQFVLEGNQYVLKEIPTVNSLYENE